MSKNRYPRLLGFLPLLGMFLMLGGCKWTLMDPKGQIGLDQRNLIITATLLMLLVVVPVIIMTFAFAWKYRASNTSATYAPKWSHSTKIEIAVWLVPILIIIALGYITYKSTHELDPYRPLESDVKPINIQVVALDWKWLFIYPDLGIATVNQIRFPENTPLNFRITSDAVMNSFFIPALGGQIYAMAGCRPDCTDRNEKLKWKASPRTTAALASPHEIQSDLDEPGRFQRLGRKVKAAPKQLDQAEYDALTKPSQNNPVALYSAFEPNLFQKIVDKYEGMKPGKPVKHEKKEVAAVEGSDAGSHSTAGAEE